MTPRPRTLKPPKHLKAAGRRYWLEVHANFELEDHHEPIVTLAAEALDLATAARKVIDEHGMTFQDRLGNFRPRPEIQIARDARISFARLVRELRLDVEPDNRLPGLNGGRAQIPRGGGLA